MDTTLFTEQSVDSRRILYTPSVFARSSLLHLQEIGSLQALRAHESRRKNLTSYLFFMVLSGRGTLEYGGQEGMLSAGDCVFLDCRKPYAHKTLDTDLWSLRWVHFYGPNVSNIYDKYRERGGKTWFHANKFEAYQVILRELYEIADSHDYVKDMRINEKMSSLVTLLMEESWNPFEGGSITPKRQNLQQVKEYLDQHYCEKIYIDELARIFYINKFYLTKIFKEQFDITINAYLVQKRITHAKQLLRFTDNPIEQIGCECGIKDANYFSRVFKRMEGITPGEFRDNWQSKNQYNAN